MNIEQEIKSVWPTSLGACRFGTAKEGEVLPYSILFRISGNKATNDNTGQFRYQADIYTRELDTESVQSAIDTIDSDQFSFYVDNYRWEYVDEKRMYRNIVDLIIMAEW